MDQTELRQWEDRCIQEEPPWCTAACPLHVDVRGLMGHIRNERWQKAWQILVKSLPLPRLLARLCDAPCKHHCKRSEVDNALEISALERVCVDQAATEYRMTLLPSKGKQIAVVGSGLSGLCLAWDLIRKGYGIVVFDPDGKGGDFLIKKYAVAVSKEKIIEEIGVLEKWGVIFNTEPDLHSKAFLGNVLNEYDAVYLSLEAQDSPKWDLLRNPDGTVKIEAKIQAAGPDKLFAGGQSSSTIFQAAQGRWAATSIDRFLQKVSLTAGREKEGPCETRLFTSLKGVEPKPVVAMADPVKGYSVQEASQEARRCLLCQCLECVKACPYLEEFGAFPRKYAREIFNNESMFMGARTANTMINSCSLCGLCEAVCPQGFAMQDLCLQTRQSMVARDHMPPSAHEFALEDMAFSIGENFFLARNAPLTDQSTHLFFPGCQLCASSPEKVEALYRYLLEKIPGKVGLMLGCCGAPAHWAGREKETDAVLLNVKAKWEKLARPELITACSSCYELFTKLWPEASVKSVWQVLEEVGLPDTDVNISQTALAVHDPCTTRNAPEIQQAVRRIMQRLGVKPIELPLSENYTECCGFGGLMDNANPKLAQKVIERRAALNASDYLAYCAMCRDRLAAAGKGCLHLLDLVFPSQDDGDPARRERPGWSQRRENRARLKARLLEDLWGEAPQNALQRDALTLKISSKVQTLLDQRRILEDDIRQVIARAESGGPKLRHPQTGRFKASFRPRLVTFWVEYAPIEGGFEVFNAYTHRMEVKRS